ncbi:Hypothetical protein KFL_000020650 [Klebsormidium nitens]|uniref:Chlorophyllase n=1 Tax=Klebsormidium nitens TaxID=105231 RepID=A0A1Y1HGZ9_KLENI|nr:Hypothetical protein KFL_000020650 [Klebsormidium nitens]|eukprot:GAQ77704.1 Hypothetical protein KFL_000020650 [Klebsormidium nitens]
MLTLGASILSLVAAGSSEAEPEEEKQPAEVIRERNAEKVRKEVGSQDLLVDYTKAGPYDIRTLPTVLEHTCANCYPQCVDGGCLLRIKVTYPGNGRSGHEPYPLAIFSGGFLVSSDQYQSYADRLASWGYVVLTYNKAEGLTGPLDDVLSARFISELITWAEQSRILKSKIDTRRVYLCGHSRGGKISVLAAAQDQRVAALCLLDPVDNTVYAPLAPGYPSAVAALRVGRDGTESIRGPAGPKTVLVKGRYLAASLPIAIVGGAFGGDCAPPDANYRQFYNASSSPSWEVVIREAGHFQFVDNASTLQDAVCGSGRVDSKVVNDVSKAVMVTWAELMIRGKRATRRDASPSRSSEAPPDSVDALSGFPATSTSGPRMTRRDQDSIASASPDVRSGSLDDARSKESRQSSDSSASGSGKVSSSKEAGQAAVQKASGGDLSIPKRALAGAASPAGALEASVRESAPGSVDRGTENGALIGGLIKDWVEDHKGEEAALFGSRIWSVAEAVEAITKVVRQRAMVSSQLRL